VFSQVLIALLFPILNKKIEKIVMDIHSCPGLREWLQKLEEFTQILGLTTIN
jgi:hypothetical protein